MARAKVIAEEKVEEKNVRKVEMVYVVPLKLYSFVVKIRDENGNLVKKVDPNTGIPRIMEDGSPVYIEKTLRFNNVIDNVMKGTFSEFTVYSDTEPAVKDRLKELCDDRRSSVITREEWIKFRNPEQWSEMQRRKNLAVELEGTYIPIIEQKDAVIAELHAQLEELTKG